MKIFNINRRMPLSETLQRVGTTDSKAFGRTTRTYRKGGLMFTIIASQSEWTEFDSSGYLRRMEMITDHLSDEDASLLYRSEATTSRGVAAVNSFIKKLDEAQEAEEAKARKAKAEKAAAEQTAAMEAAEAARQQKLAEMMTAMLEQNYGLKPMAAQQNAAVPTTPTEGQTAAAAPTPTATATTPTPTADQQQSATAITQQEINVMVAEALKQCGFQPTTATAPATPPTPPATPQAPADDKSKGNSKKK